MAAHKHAEVIKAWADGATIEFRVTSDHRWKLVQGEPVWNKAVEYRVKPAEPERVYPVTRMKHQEMWAVYEYLHSERGVWSLEEVANAALRHACDAGQIVTREEFDHAIGDRKARDMAVARAVRNKCADMFSPLSQVRGLIDILDLEAIIAEVEP